MKEKSSLQRYYAIASVLSTLGYPISIMGMVMSLAQGSHIYVGFCTIIMACITYSTFVIKPELSDRIEQIGLPSSLNYPIPANHGDTINRVINGFRREPVEHIAIFNRAEKKLIEQTCLNPHEVSSDLDDESWLEAISIHSHPGSDEFPHTERDYESMINAREYQSIVVTRHKLYIATNPFYDELPDDTEELEAEIVAYYRKLESRKITGFLINKTRILGRLTMIHINRKVCKRFSFEFDEKPIWLANLETWTWNILRNGQKRLLAAASVIAISLALTSFLDISVFIHGVAFQYSGQAMLWDEKCTLGELPEYLDDLSYFESLPETNPSVARVYIRVGFADPYSLNPGMVFDITTEK